MSCSGPRNEAPPSADPATTAATVALTPGVCGPWETTDSAALVACRKGLLHPLPGAQPIRGDCAYYQTTSLDSLRACLSRFDSSASGCAAAGVWRVHQADGVDRRAEWRRCGPQGGAMEGDSIVWPLQFLLLRRDTLPGTPVIFGYSNSEEPGVGGLDTVLAIDLDRDGSDELFYVDRIYGTGAIFEFCAMAVVNGKLQCWSGPDFPTRELLLRPGETLFKGWVQVPSGPGENSAAGTQLYAPGRSLWYTTPVYRDGDANCCPTGEASLWLEARPVQGRFQTGLVIRTREDSMGALLGADTLRR